MYKYLIILKIIILIVFLSFIGCIEEKNPHSIDTDGDGYFDEVDNFPNDYKEWLDSDNDGIGNNADSDDDNDGYTDDRDYSPYKDAKIKITLDKFKVLDEVDNPPKNSSKTQIYFEISINNNIIERIPNGENIFDVNVGELKAINWSFIYNIQDDLLACTINIHMYSASALQYEELDIDGHDSSKGLSIIYYLSTETWIGDDGDGITDGSDDGTQYADDNDAYLEYNFETA